MEWAASRRECAFSLPSRPFSSLPFLRPLVSISCVDQRCPQAFFQVPPQRAGRRSVTSRHLFRSFMAGPSQLFLPRSSHLAPLLFLSLDPLHVAYGSSLTRSRSLSFSQRSSLLLFSPIPFFAILFRMTHLQLRTAGETRTARPGSRRSWQHKPASGLPPSPGSILRFQGSVAIPRLYQLYRADSGITVQLQRPVLPCQR